MLDLRLRWTTAGCSHVIHSGGYNRSPKGMSYPSLLYTSTFLVVRGYRNPLQAAGAPLIASLGLLDGGYTVHTRANYLTSLKLQHSPPSALGADLRVYLWTTGLIPLLMRTSKLERSKLTTAGDGERLEGNLLVLQIAGH